MAKMPGEMIEGPWSPEGDAEQDRKARSFKPEMAEVKPPVSPFGGPTASEPAAYSEPAKPSLWERTKEHFNYQVNHGFFALGDLIGTRLEQVNAEERQAELTRMRAEGQGETAAAKRAELDMFRSAGAAEMARNQRAEDNFRFENMPAAEGFLENAAAVAGGFAGSIDPTIVVAEAKIGTTAWRMGSPIVSKMLDYGVSNAAMNALLNASVQAGELGADMREEIDWDSVMVDAGVGAVLGVPFGYIAGRAARDEMAQLVQAPEPGMAPWAPPRTGPRVENVPKPERVPDQTTVESISEAHAPEEITAAQETLFGEVVGTRNLTPEQLNQVDDYINAGKPYGEEFPRETTVQDMPPVREPAQSEAEPLPQVPERGQPEGGADPAPADASPERPKGVSSSANYLGLNADGNQIWEWPHKDGPRRIEVRPGKSNSLENPSMLSGPGFAPYERQANFEVVTPAQNPPAKVPERGQPEGGADPAPADASPERPKGVSSSANYLGLNADGNQIWEWPHKDGPRRIEVRPGKSNSLENPSMLSGPGFAPYERQANFEVVTPAQNPPAKVPAPLVAGDFQDLKPEDLKIDAKRFQFKGGGDEEGVIDTLKKVKTWDRKKAGVIMVWEDLAGNKFVVDGHQRYGLAKRLKGEGQDPTLHAMIWREADGISADDAKVLAADINISQGSGTAVDAAKILRSRPEMMGNLPKNAVTEHGVGLARLSDDAFGMVVNGKVPPEYGALVGKLAPNTSTHAQIMDVLAKNEPASAAQAESMVRDVLSAPEVEQTMSDMFGSAEVTQILFKERAQVLSSAATALRKDRAAFNTLVKEEARLTGAGNKLATATNLERAQTDAEILATLQATARRKGPVADALAAAAKSLHDGTPRQVAVREFLDKLRAPASASPDGPGVSPSSQSIAASLGGYRNTETPAFQRWFGESKVVDENGDPLMVYHGTTADFEQFAKDLTSARSSSGQKGAIFLSSNSEVANGYAMESKTGGNVMPVYVALKNPLIVDDPRPWRMYGAASFEAWIEKARKEGHDGLIFRRVADEVDVDDRGMNTADRAIGDTIVAFEPTQIKSIYNRGTWDAADPRIAFSAPANNDQFRAFIAARKAEKETFDASLRTALDKFNGFRATAEVTDYKGRQFTKTVTVTKSLQPGVEWQVTFMDDLGPSGHLDMNSFAEMADQVRSMIYSGYKPDAKYGIAPLTVKVEDYLPKKSGIAFSAPKGPGLTSQMERMLTLASGKIGAPDNIYGDQINEARRAGWIESKNGYTATGNSKTRYFITDKGREALAGKGLFDVGADKKPQAVLPGAERIGDKTLAERRAAAPLKSAKPQKDLDFGLFGSGKGQMDLLDMVQKKDVLFRVTGEGDYLDFTPGGGAKNTDIGGVSITYSATEDAVEIIAVRTPTQQRNNGLASAALDEFLRAADEQGYIVKAYVKPMDRATTPEGLQKLFTKFGFEPGQTPGQMVRNGPTVGQIASRALDDSFAAVARLIEMGAEIAEIATHPFILGAVRRMEAIPLTDMQPGFMSDAWKASRTYEFPEGAVAGYDAAVSRLTEDAKLFSTAGPVKRERKATVMLGPPAAGKSTFAEKFATVRYAAIVDPDEAKKVIPEFNRGIGANAVHEESALMANEVMAQLIADGANLVIPKVGHNDKGIRKLILMLKENGYAVDLVNINVTYENAFRRMVNRFLKTGRLINPEYVAAVGDNPSATYRTLRQQGIADRYAEIDANGQFGEPSKILDDTGATEGIPGLGGGREQGVRPGDAETGSQVRAQDAQGGIAFAAPRPQPMNNMPVNRSQAGVTTNQNVPGVGRLEQVSETLRSVTGAPVRQGRLARAPRGAGKVAGQYDRNQGVIRLREASDFDTQAHETAHSLETEWGRSLDTLKRAHTAELEPLAYAGADPRQQLSEGFAEWFRFFVTTPAYAHRVAPKFTAAFVNMLEAGDRLQLDKIRAAQEGYRNWTSAPSAAVVAADIVSSRKGGMISEAIAEAGGPREALAEFASKTYTSLIDKLNPINRAVDELMKVYEKRTGRALNIKSAQDPYRLGRLSADSYSAGHIDAMHGVVPYRGVVSEGASLSDAITTALGSTWRSWDDTAMADFAAYLVSRRALQEYDRFLAGEIPNPPGKFTRGDYEVTRQELEAAHPNYVQAADMVYEWGRNMLRKKYEAGFITQELYEELLKRKDYVPMMRDLRDLDKEAGGTGGNLTLRSSILKAFKGSKRSVINPLETMMADAYAFNALMKRNDVFRALSDLAEMAGPGAGAIVERIPSTQLKGSKVGVTEVLRSAAKDAGLSPDDVDHLTSFVDDLLGDDATGTVFRAGEINEAGEPIIYMWKNGKKQALRLADGDFGRDLYDAMTGMNKEMRNLFVSVMALPTTIVRYGVTTAPHFVMANYIRDQISAWVLVGDGYIPFISGAAGLRDELTQREVTRIYNTFGGISGGANVASLDKGRAKRDINALNKKGYTIKRFSGIRGLSELTGLTETGTRLGIFKNSFARAKRDGLTDYEAAVEAAFQARDYIDFGRHGSQTHVARRLVTFLNASVQGLEKTYRVLSAEGAIRKALTPIITHKAGRPLTARDKANLAKSASAWAKVTAIGMFGLGLSYLYRDDPEYEEISEYLRATHWMVKKGPGDWYAIPKPFELGFVSNMFEASFESAYKGNPVAMESFYAGLYEVTAPPMGIPLFETMYELKHNRDGLGRDIVGQDIAGFEPWRQYTAHTSEIAKALGGAVNVSPAKIDHALQGWGASWGKIITDASSARAQGRSEVEVLSGAMTNRFVRDVTRGSTSSMQFWGLVSESTGEFAKAAKTYQDLAENGAPGAGEQMLASKDENTKAFALMQAHFKPDVERLNPLVRAKDSIAVMSALRKELAGNKVVSSEDSTDEEQVTLTLNPTQRKMAQEFLARLQMIEARNSLVVMGVPGWKQKTLMETASLYEDLRTTSPELADEMEARMVKKKVYDFEAVREAWPDVKARVLEDGKDADFSDILAGME